MILPFGFNDTARLGRQSTKWFTSVNLLFSVVIDDSLFVDRNHILLVRCVAEMVLLKISPVLLFLTIYAAGFRCINFMVNFSASMTQALLLNSSINNYN